ncbi:MAG: PD-(D/E)XK nuclease family protein [Bacteroidales bacterium]|jgi:CRISPR/Cas system-associated exonuclease Cas4 (RecB family)|nr:PD-(D/E)XK nuclease family protein [Bacteroidales bacterium]
MKSFLLQTAEYIKTNYSNDLPNICIVVPGKRSIVFLKKQLASLYEKPFLSPAFFSIEDFFSFITGVNPATKEEQLLALYQIHLSLLADKKEQEQTLLHEFSAHAQLMITDFNEIDVSLADTDVLFSSLYSIKELSFFGKREEELSPFQKNYLGFFKELAVYYKQFTNHLLKQNKGYQGLIYRKAAENISRYIDSLPYLKYVFIGFNALTKAEEVVIEYLLKADKLDYLVDGDVFYIKNKIHEAGRFIRNIQRLFQNNQPLQFIGNYFAETPKNIHIMGLPQSVTQAKFLNEIIGTIQSSDNTLDNTAIVLADETLLLPVLHAIDTTDANITMGYPVKRTILYQLVSNFLIALENRDKFNRNAQETNIKLYHKDLFIFFNNPYICDMLGRDNSQEDIPAKLQRNAKLFYAKQDYQQLITKLSPSVQMLFFELFYAKNTVSSVCNNIRTLLVEIQKKTTLNFAERETLFLLYKYTGELQNALSLLDSMDITSFRFLFENYVSELTLSFHSEATTGLQILGVLETRTLDFKNVILLSVNEGIIPAGKAINSFIPYDVKTHFGLQTYRGKDAIFSYHFYRLLQRAEHIYLLYNLDAKNGAMEKSRFLYQLKNELKTFDNIKITDEIIASPPINPETETSVCIQKTEDILISLKQKKYSASSISAYLECGLRFYFQYVLELEETNAHTIDDMLQSATIGTVIHAVLEKAVENGRFKRMTKTEIEQNVRTHICNNKQLNLTEEDLLYEKNHLVFQIIVKYIDSYLKHVQSFEKDVMIEQTEEKLERTLLVDDSAVITLKGIIDRVDLWNNGNKRIVDYKTGKLQDAELKVKDMETIFDGKHTKAFQLLFYAYLYGKQYNPTYLEAEIISFRKLDTSYILSIDKEKQLSEEVLADFENGLIQVIQSILYAETSLTATPFLDRCKYCSYKDICRR